jgi:hypothetical protein
MQKFIHNLALLASLVALGAGLWQDWGVWLAIKRMAISYLIFLAAGSLGLLAMQMVLSGRGMESANVRELLITRKVGK